MKFCCFFILFLLTLHGSLQSSNHWDYQAVNDWSGACAIGQKQSPIDIRGAEDVNLPAWKFTGYNLVRKIKIYNNGHSFKFTLDGKAPQISGGGLPDPFTFWSGHFHWGNVSSRGSEHMVGGQAYPLELHLVHFNSKYGNLGEALPNPDGLAVLSVLFDISAEDNPSLSLLVSGTSSVTLSGTNSDMQTPLSLGSLLPDDSSSFYRYSGSLTTPSCDEVVTWTVLHQTNTVSESQLKTLRTLVDSGGNKMGDIFRPVQPLHGRKVVASGLNLPLDVKYRGQSESNGIQGYSSMVPGWAVVLLCLAVGLNVAAVVTLLMRRGKQKSKGGHHIVPNYEPKEECN